MPLTPAKEPLCAKPKDGNDDADTDEPPPPPTRLFPVPAVWLFDFLCRFTVVPVALALSFCRAVAELEDFGIFWLLVFFGVAILKIAHQITYVCIERKTVY